MTWQMRRGHWEDTGYGEDRFVPYRESEDEAYEAWRDGLSDYEYRLLFYLAEEAAEILRMPLVGALRWEGVMGLAERVDVDDLLAERKPEKG